MNSNRTFKPGIMAVVNMTSDFWSITRVKIIYTNKVSDTFTMVVDNPPQLKVVGNTNILIYEYGLIRDYWKIIVEYKHPTMGLLTTVEGGNRFSCNIDQEDNGLVLFSLHLDPLRQGTIFEKIYALVHFSYSRGCEEKLGVK